jgi:hypothetical protein
MEKPYSWLYWVGEYLQWSRNVFGCDLPPLLSNSRMKCSSSFDPESKYGQIAIKGLIEAETAYCEDLLINIRENSVPGHIVEFGVFQGGWINKLYELTRRVGLDREVWGFDSFEGLSAPDSNLDDQYWKEGMFAASLEAVEQNVKLAERPRIKVVKGWFEDSLQSERALLVEQFAFARIDCDIYQPAKECLAYLSSRLAHGSVLVFDDWSHRLDLGETRAFVEWVPTVQHLEFEFLFYGAWDHFYLRVWHKGQKRF